MTWYDPGAGGGGGAGPCRRGAAWLALCWVLGWGGAAGAAELETARSGYLRGDYTGVVVLAEQALEEDDGDEEWSLLRIQGLCALGRYAEAEGVLTNALAHARRSLRLRWQAREVYRANGRPALAAESVRDLLELAAGRPGAYREALDLVVIGRAALVQGADPRQVMDRIYGVVRKAEPKLREVQLASGELALEKHDFALAAKVLQEAVKELPDDADLHQALARAYAPSDPALMLASVKTALEQNTNHVGSLLLWADHHLDAEDYSKAEALLARARSVNPWHPEAWAYEAVLAHLRHQPDREHAAREMALRFWTNNPAVPHLIGRKLSRNYRFAEGAACQREALAWDATFLPARAQLAQDLLRLGEEEEGWRLAEEVQARDGYDVTALNLMTLRDTLAKFETLTNAHFVVRMAPAEAGLYGPRVLELLGAARDRLGSKYGLELARPVLVEVFPNQKDFAVRTFGLPENHGFLGVCFGHVITANSPASHPGQPFNWESMLWHEFCHVITLQLSRNKMPRWLSEGISVYEERQANPAWGESMTPRYREFLLAKDLAPVSELSAAFLSPPTPVHLQFAYYQASLVVEFLVERFGVAALNAVLRDLGEGLAVNAAMEQRMAPVEVIDRDFAAYARQRAERFGPGLDWEAPPRGGRDRGDAWSDWARNRPSNYWVLSRQAEALLEGKQWAEAREVLERLVQACPEVGGSEGAYGGLAAALRGLGDHAGERSILERWARVDGDAVEAYARLMELDTEARDWAGVARHAERFLAVNPLTPVPYRALAAASEARGEWGAAATAYRALVRLDPPNPAEAHYRLARALHRLGDPGAKREVLRALEEAPRHQPGLHLLRALHETAPPASAAPTPPAGSDEPAAPQPPAAPEAAAPVGATIGAEGGHR